MVRRTDGKWWTDKDKEKKFSTLEEAKAYEASIPETPKPGVVRRTK